jgi:hypothetical protein
MGSTLPQSVLNGLIEWGVIALIFWVIPIWIIALSVSRCAWELRHIARTLYYGSESERQTHNKTVAQH